MTGQMTSDRWLLPDGVEEILPEAAWRMEQQRRRLVETFHSWGFDLVMPPMVEYLESLLTGAGEELSTRTFTVTDQLTGRLMGIRADMTPQVARIDAHYLSRRLRDDTSAADDNVRNHQLQTRLCYAGPTLQTLPRTLGGSREPFQFGAELFGVSGPEGDCEIVTLMIECMSVLGLDSFALDLGHVGIFRALADNFNADEQGQNRILKALATKSSSDIEAAVAAAGLTTQATDAFRDLTEFAGASVVIDEARRRYHDIPELLDALNNLQSVVDLIRQFAPDLDISIDLAEFRGYRYHTGIVYSLLAPGSGKPVARGGRYDGVGLAFGRARPATGFSGDLRQLRKMDAFNATALDQNCDVVVAAPFSADSDLDTEIRKLRADGYRVVRMLIGQSVEDIPNCQYELVKKQDTAGLATNDSTQWQMSRVDA